MNAHQFCCCLVHLWSHLWSSWLHKSCGSVAGQNPRCSGDSGFAVFYEPFISLPTLLSWIGSSTATFLFLYLLTPSFHVKMILKDLRRTQWWLLKFHLSDLTQGSCVLCSGSNQFSHLAGESCRVLGSHCFIRSILSSVMGVHLALATARGWMKVVFSLMEQETK